MRPCREMGTPACRCVRQSWFVEAGGRPPLRRAVLVLSHARVEARRLAQDRSREPEPETVRSPSLGSGLASGILRPPPLLSGHWLGCEQGDRQCRGTRGLKEGIILLFKKLM